MDPIELDPVAHLADGSTAPLQAEVSRTEKAGYHLYDVSVVNTGATPLAVRRVQLFERDFGVSDLEVFRQGFYMPSDASGFALLRAGEDAPSHLRDWKPECFGKSEFLSHTVAVTNVPGHEEKTLFGFTTGSRFEGLLVFDTAGAHVTLRVLCNLEGISLKPGLPTRLEQLMVMTANDFNACLTAYADYTAAANRALVPAETVTGWSDWQYYRHHKTEDDIHRNVEALRTLTERGFPLKYIVIDNGFCRHMSEWLEPSDSFPSGMAHLGEFVRTRGFELGVWLAPYIANENTRVVKEHPEWLVRDPATGGSLHQPATNVGPAYVIDFTHPGAVDWLRGIVRAMVRDWGARYIKLDGPRPRHHEGGLFHDPDMTGIQMIRRSLEAIRAECDACTRDTVIIEGEGIYGPSIGMVDLQRTTQDNWDFWYYPESGKPAMKENMKNDLLSAFMHGRFWHNHRENVILRDFPSPIHAFTKRWPDSKDIVMADSELRLQVSAFALAGGAMLLTDPMDQLLRNPEKQILISQFLPPYEGPPCFPLDTFTGGQQPCFYLKPVNTGFEEWWTLGVFNWEDECQSFDVPLEPAPGHGAWHAFEFWTESYLGQVTGRLRVEDVPAHTCRLIALRRPTGRPQLLGTNMHVFQGAVDIESVSYREPELVVRVTHPEQRERKLFVATPEGFELEDIETNADDFLADTRRRDVTVVQFNGRATTELRMRWHTPGGAE